ncbi:MAG: hypothetical protein V4578_16825, partial [Pseudomonadota bacterium]
MNALCTSNADGSSDSTTAKLTLITSTTPLGKTYHLTEKGLEKTTAAAMQQGSFTVQSFKTVIDFAALIMQVGPNQAITASIPKNGAVSGQLTTKANAHRCPDALTRTKDHFHFTPGQRGLIV